VRALALVNLTLLYFSSAGATTMLRSSLPMTSRLSRLPTSASAACDVVAGGGAYLVGTYLHARDFALLLCVRASRRKSSAVRGVGCIEPQRGAGGALTPRTPSLRTALCEVLCVNNSGLPGLLRALIPANRPSSFGSSLLSSIEFVRVMAPLPQA